MSLYSKKFRKLSKKYLALKKEVEDEIEEIALKGKVFVWKKGEFEGRKCVVKYVSFDYEWYPEERLIIHMVVETYRKDGKGLLAGYDYGARHYLELDEWFTDM